MWELFNFEERIRQAGRDQNPWALQHAMLLVEKEKGSALSQSDVNSIVELAAKIDKKWESAHEAKTAITVSEESEQGEPREVTRYRNRRDSLSELACKRLKPRVEELRRELFATSKPPFTRILDALDWIQQNAANDLQEASVISQELFEVGERCPLAVDELYRSIRRIEVWLDRGIVENKRLWSKEKVLDAKRLNRLGFNSRLFPDVIPTGGLYSRWFIEKGSVLEAVWQFIFLAKEDTGCDGTSALALLLLGEPVVVSPVRLSYANSPWHPPKDVEVPPNWPLGMWEFAIYLRGIGPVSAVKWEDLRLAWRDIQRAAASETRPVEEVVESLGGVPQRGKNEFWKKVACIIGTPTGNAARMAWRRAVGRA